MPTKKINLNTVKSHYYLFILAFILILSFFMNFFLIGKTGTGNEYYAACIKSMTQSFHNFFYVSFDPAGMVSVDKSPLGLWIQAIFCMIFGYSGYAMLLPQALAGTASALMLYIIGSKYFNRIIGLLSAFLFSLLPVVVVVSRNNTIDMQLIFVLLISVYFVLKSIQTNKWRWLMVAGVLIGLGFNIKMFQAYLILPAIAIVYLFFSNQKVWKRFVAGILSCLVMLSVSSLWVLAVFLTPAENRPYIDSTSNNSIVELIFGHNGLERLFGQSTGPNNMQDGNNSNAPPNQNNNSLPNGNIQDGNTQDGDNSNAPPNQNDNIQDGMGGGSMDKDIGEASLFRLWNNGLYGQVAWLLLFALISFSVSIRKKLILKKDITQSATMLFGIWLISVGLFFSFAGFYHSYYLSMIAPAISILTAIGINSIYTKISKKPKSKSSGNRFFILIAGLIANAVISIVYLLNYPQAVWLIPSTVAILIIGLSLTFINLYKPPHNHKKFISISTTAILVFSMILSSTYWSIYTILSPNINSTLPSAGPQASTANKLDPENKMQPDDMSDSQNSYNSLSDFSNYGMPNQPNDSINKQNNAMLNYLVSNYKENSFLVTSCRSNSVADFIIQTGLPCYAYGGFLGNNTFSVERLKQLVDEGRITYFLIDDLENKGGIDSMQQDGSTKDDDINSYVKNHATKIDSSEFGGDSNQNSTLYKFN